MFLMLIFLSGINEVSAISYNVEETPIYVKSTSHGSCRWCTYSYGTGIFLNYCPNCKHYGTLTFNKKGTPEGEWTCKRCDSDYCAKSGHEKTRKRRGRLIKLDYAKGKVDIKVNITNIGYKIYLYKSTTGKSYKLILIGKKLIIINLYPS